MLIHPWDAALDEQEWGHWLAAGHDFGQLAVNGSVGQPPVVIPTHFVAEPSLLLVHLARPNPVWKNVQRDPQVLFTVVDDYAYVPTMWRAKTGDPEENGVPTSYYAAVQFTCHAEIIDDPAAKAELLRRQMAHFQPEGGHAPITADNEPYGRLLSGIRGLHLHVTSVAAKFKYDDNKPVTQRAATADRLQDRARPLDQQVAHQQRRRLGQVGEWNSQAQPRP